MRTCTPYFDPLVQYLFSKNLENIESEWAEISHAILQGRNFLQGSTYLLFSSCSSEFSRQDFIYSPYKELHISYRCRQYLLFGLARSCIMNQHPQDHVELKTPVRHIIGAKCIGAIFLPNPVAQLSTQHRQDPDIKDCHIANHRTGIHSLTRQDPQVLVTATVNSHRIEITVLMRSLPYWEAKNHAGHVQDVDR